MELTVMGQGHTILIADHSPTKNKRGKNCMKISTLLSFAAVAGVSAGSASAQDVIPELSASVDVCHDWAENQEDPTHKKAAHERCSAIARCMAEQSDNQSVLRECLFAAESRFQSKTSTGVPTGPEIGVDTPVETEVPDSDYDHPERNKGWEYSEQGG
ncbi:MAG TPA: hypothetical protein DEP85_07365 [Holosporales bacterium]|nr:hypothetical protein [Holosporales bacterium]